MVMSVTPHERNALMVLDRWLAHRSAMCAWVGVQIAIRRRGELIFNKAYGFANADAKRKLTSRHLGHFASHSKMFTACALLRLQEAGRVTLETKLSDVLPEFYRHKDRRFREITLRDILSHRAGLMRDGSAPDYWEYETAFPDREALLADLKTSTLVYAPNTVSKYSNTGYGLLGLVIERIAGMPYDAFVQQEILARLGKAAIEPDYVSASGGRYADGHGRIWKEGRRAVLKHARAEALAPATGFCATAESMSGFLHEYLSGERLIGRATQTELRSVDWPIANSTVERYGVGLAKYALDDKWIVGHTGGFPGFKSASLQTADGDYVVSLYINSDTLVVATAKGILKLFTKIRETFDEREIEQVEVTPALHCVWGSELFVVGRKRALEVGIDGGALQDDWQILERAGDGYKSDRKNGYRNVGQPISFVRDKAGRIVATRGMGASLIAEAAFEKRLRKARQ